MSETISPDIVKVRLDLISVHLNQIASKELLRGSAEAFQDFMHEIGDNFQSAMRGYLIGEELEDKVIKHPRDWYRAFKERWLPVFILRRWPVVYMVHHVGFNALYPNYKPKLPQESHVIVDKSWWDVYPMEQTRR